MHLRLVFNGGITEASTNALRHRIATALERDNLESGIHLHVAGHVESMAIPVVLGGAKRTATPSSRFVFHAYDWGFEGRQLAERIVEAQARLDDDIGRSKEIVRIRANIPSETLADLYSRSPKARVVTAEEAIAWGLVEEIVELNPSGERQPGVEVWTVGW